MQVIMILYGMINAMALVEMISRWEILGPDRR